VFKKAGKWRGRAGFLSLGPGGEWRRAGVGLPEKNVAGGGRGTLKVGGGGAGIVYPGDGFFESTRLGGTDSFLNE